MKKQSDAIENMRLAVVEQELSTRSWVAMRDKMQATIDIANMQEKYDAVLAENNARLQKAQEEHMKKMQEQANMHQVLETPNPETT